MEIITLLKAGIKSRKGAFISIVLLMLIASLSLSTIISTVENNENSIENAHVICDTADITMIVNDCKYDDTVVEQLKNHELVDRVEIKPVVLTENVYFNGDSDNVTGQTMILLKQDANMKVMNETMHQYLDKAEPLEKGCIYVTQGFLTRYNLKLGDKVTICANTKEYEYEIKAAVLEPVVGSYTIGWKQLYISDYDFNIIYNDSVSFNEQYPEKNECYTAKSICIYKNKSCNLSDGKFRKRLNTDTGVVDMANITITKTESISYTGLFMNVVAACLFVFAGILVVIVIIVMGHSISASIDLDYVNIGTLKSQGFDNSKIRLIFICQYIFAELIGIALGIIGSLFLIPMFVDIMQPITAIISEHHIYFLKMFILFMLVIAISVLVIFVITKKLSKVSPVRAIQGGRREIYFDSRIRLAISKKLLSASIGFRQFTSNLKKYISTVVVVGLLMFFMMTVMILANALESKTAGENMGYCVGELEFRLKEPDEKMITEICETIEEHTKILKKYYYSHKYYSFEGEQIMGVVYSEDFTPATKGRAPKYENEIMITEIVADEFDIKIGDKVKIGVGDNQKEYIITGYMQFLFDAGRVFAMKNEDMEVYFGLLSLENPEKAEELVEILTEKFGDKISIQIATDETDIITSVLKFIKGVIFIFSAIFLLVVVMMMCNRAFMQERIDIGIYKAIGFTSGKLRLQFAFRFLAVSVVGSILGIILSLLFSGKLLVFLLRSVGLTRFNAEISPQTILIPFILISVCFFVFSYIASGVVKRVAAKELVVE